jgi:hypothetical protein
MAHLIRAWLAEIPWDLVEFQNASLCEAKNALHKPTSDGYAITKELWEANHLQEMGLLEVVDLCRRCHRLAPFCFYNGNTFAAIARSLIQKLEVSQAQAAVLRSLAGHIVAGVASDEEVKAFRAFCQSG